MNHSQPTPTYHRPSRLIREKHNQLVEIIRKKPGISTGEIAKLFYPHLTEIGAQKRESLTGMLLTIQCANQIDYKNDHYYLREET